ncbi:MAG: AAA family ATPase, partial [Verrucomicrobia bacterium]|nr:AAA family ATPase [Verrucomicrobiota bacterium]
MDLLAPADRFRSASRLYGKLHRWWLLVGRYGWVLVLILGIVLGPVYFLTALSPPAFQSKARMWLTGRLDLYEGRLYTEELINYLGTEAELLRSPTIQQRALQRLLEQFKQNPALLSRLLGPRSPTVGGRQPLPQGRPGLGAVAAGPAPRPFPFEVKVAEGSKSSTLELRAIGPDPALTRAFLNDLMDEFLRFKKEAREKASDETVASLTNEVRQLKSQLEAQQEKLHAFESSNNVVFLQQQGDSAAGYLGSLNRRLAGLRTELRLLTSLQPEQWAEMRLRQQGAAAGEPAADDAAARQMLASLAEPQLELFKANQQMELLKAKRSELTRFLRPLHPKIIKLNDEIATQEQVVHICREEALKQMVRRREVVESQIQNLEAESAEWDAKAIQASRRMADFEQIRRGLDRLQAAYDKALALIQTVDVSKKVEQENIGILEPASVGRPTHRLLINLAIGLAGALILGFGVLYGLALFRDDFTSPAELAEQLSVPVLGQIPAICLRQPEDQPGIDLLDRQRFEFLEAFRSLRSSVLFMGNGRAKPKSIVVASSVPAEGKSTVALYLAATLAKANARVLLVDADMRRAGLHKFFGLPLGPGLAELLGREVSFGEAVVPTSLENLILLPAGEPKRNPGDLLWSAAWAEFLTEAGPQFDYILADSPPVLATEDAAALAPKVDGVLFVVRGSCTSAR